MNLNQYIKNECNFTDDNKQIILNIVNKYCPSKLRPKYTNEYYLNNIILMLNDMCKWKSLSILDPNKPKYHYKTIQKKFTQWSSLNIFKMALDEINQKYIYSNYNSTSTINLYIDGTLIYNANGSEYVNYGRIKKKKNTNLSIIADENNVIHGITAYQYSRCRYINSISK